MTTPRFPANEASFLEAALGSGTSTWSRGQLERLAGLSVPRRLLGEQQFLLKGDVRIEWARWFVECLADPRRYVLQRASYPRILEDVFARVQTRFGHLDIPEQRELASAAARILLDSVQRLQATRDRKRLSREQRRRLLDLAGASPRCWICGAEFLEPALESFLHQVRTSVPLPPFVDILKPRGLLGRDLSIEVDHIVPHSQGGGDDGNLAVACGWCNRNKRDHTSLYDVEGRPKRAGSNTFGVSSLPQPFWTVRVLATVRTCEHPDGCTRSAKNADITVAPIVREGTLNPVNLQVTCSEHDPYKAWRLQAHGAAKRAWGL